MILDDAKTALDKQNDKGLMKYGGSLDTTDPTVAELLEHATQEFADGLMYTCALKQKVLSEIERLRGALESAEKSFHNIRGAIESNQVVDKDAHGMAVRGRDMCRAAMSPKESTNETNKGNGQC